MAFTVCKAGNYFSIIKSVEERSLAGHSYLHVNSSISLLRCQRWNSLSSSNIRKSAVVPSSNLRIKALETSDGDIQQPVPSTDVNECNSSAKPVILVIGSGGREQALCYNLRMSGSCADLFCAPGNVGIGRIATCLPHLNTSDSEAVISFCKESGIGLVVVGAEAPLATGLANDLVRAGIPACVPAAASDATA